MRSDTKEELDDVLHDVKFSCLSWTHDHKGKFTITLVLTLIISLTQTLILTIFNLWYRS